MEPTPAASPTQVDDLTAAVTRVLAASSEPLTLPKIKSALPAAQRDGNIEEVLRRQVAAGVLHQYPKYRSPQDRFWDRPMRVHVAALIREVLQEGPLGASELRRKLPAYAQTQMDDVLQEMLANKQLHRHPRSGRGGERLGARPPEARDYLKDELGVVFARLEQLGFTPSQIRAGALELLHDEEWSPRPPAKSQPKTPEPPVGQATASPSAPAASPGPQPPVSEPGSNLPG
jgi:hypothetical protein